MKTDKKATAVDKALVDTMMTAIPLLPHKIISIQSIADAIGMTPARVMILLTLHDHPQTLSELSHALNMVSSNTSPILRAMTENGLCERIHSETDRRKCILKLTEKGEAVIELIQQNIAQQLRMWESRLTPSEIAEVETCLIRVLQVLNSSAKV